MQFRDRTEAGRVLAARMGEKYAKRPGVIVLGLPRGGVPVAFEVARALSAPLDVFMVRKLGVPGQEELAMGAIATGGVRILDRELLLWRGIGPEVVASVTARELAELERRERLYRDDRPSPDLTGRTVILVDDGLATGATMRAAIAAVRLQSPAQVVVAVPTASPDICRGLALEVDDIFCAITPEPFYAVGAWYTDFSQTTDAQVHDLLTRAAQPPAPEPPSSAADLG